MTRILILSLALAGLPAIAQNDGESISLGVGEQRTLPLQNVARVAIGDPGVADVKQVGGGELLITGAGEGHTSLPPWLRNGGSVRGTPRLVWVGNDRQPRSPLSGPKQEPRTTVSEVRALLGDRDGIR